jgi:hypothetical protein
VCFTRRLIVGVRQGAVNEKMREAGQFHKRDSLRILGKMRFRDSLDGVRGLCYFTVPGDGPRRDRSAIQELQPIP